MGRRDPRVDAYIARSAPFARPILEHVRELVHEACPDVAATIKWGAPSLVHAGGILAGMAAFKQPASLGYWKHALGVGEGGEGCGMGTRGKWAGMGDLQPRSRTRTHSCRETKRE